MASDLSQRSSEAESNLGTNNQKWIKSWSSLFSSELHMESAWKVMADYFSRIKRTKGKSEQRSGLGASIQNSAHQQILKFIYPWCAVFTSVQLWVLYMTSFYFPLANNCTHSTYVLTRCPSVLASSFLSFSTLEQDFLQGWYYKW